MPRHPVEAMVAGAGLALPSAPVNEHLFVKNEPTPLSCARLRRTRRKSCGAATGAGRGSWVIVCYIVSVTSAPWLMKEKRNPPATKMETGGHMKWQNCFRAYGIHVDENAAGISAAKVPIPVEPPG